MKKLRYRVQGMGLSLIALLLLASCASQATLRRENATGEVIQDKVVPVFLESGLNTQVAEGPIIFKLGGALNLQSGVQIPADTRLYGYYVTRGNRVLFAPTFVAVNKVVAVNGSNQIIEERRALSSMQTGLIGLTPSSARYAQEMKKGAIVGGVGGGVIGGIAGGLEHGLGGALVGALIGGAVGAAAGAGSQALTTWYNADQPIALPPGSGMMLHMGAEEE